MTRDDAAPFSSRPTDTDRATAPAAAKAERLRKPERLARLEVGRVLATLSPVPRRVLDIGTGSGVFAQAFLEGGAEDVAGVDLDAELVEAARVAVPGAAFQVAPAETLPFAAGSFDLVFMGLMLHESPDPAVALREARRVAPRLGVLEWKFGDEPQGPPLSRRFSVEQLRELGQAAGYSVLEEVQLREFVLYALA